MAVAHAHKDLRKGIQTGSFERVYYFHGDDEYLKDDMVRQMIDAVTGAATRDFNLDVRRGN
jgi:DNA polymerase III delta subunit